MINLSSFIAFHARRTPERPALKYRGEEISYAVFDARIRKAAGWLAAQGIGAGDVVAVLMKNSAAFLELVFATSHLGAVFLPINFRLSRDEVGYIAGNAGARLLMVDEELAANAAGAKIVVLDEAAQQSVTRLAGGAAAAPMHVRAPSDLMRLMYTSGTTDRPKGVMLSYDNFYWKSADQTIALGLSAETRLLVVGPLYHAGALDLPGIAVLWHGGFIRIERYFEPEAALAAIAEDKLNAAWFAPVMTTAMLTCPTRDRYNVSSLTWAIGGGEKTPELRIRAFSEYFRNARYIDAYGLTETVGGDTFMEAGREIEKIGSTGRAIAHVEIEIRDEDGRTLPPNVNGEICLRGPKITRGYWKDPEKTAAAFFGDWFRSGDVGYLDDEGFSVSDRSQEGHDHLRRREHRLLRGRTRHLRAIRGARGRGDRPARCALGRAAGRHRRAGGRCEPRAPCPYRTLPRAAGELQGAEAARRPRQPAAQPERKDPQARAARRAGDV
ncbi:fatty-acyl-CoA synthase [Bradyrhizobium diazoefficiens]